MTISKQIYANNAKTTVTSAVLPTDTVINVTNASIFPVISTGDYFLVTLENSGVIEIVQVNNIVGNTFTGCVRGQEGTTAVGFPAGTRVDNRVTAGTLSNLTRFVDVMASIPSLDNLSSPINSNSNSYLSESYDVVGNPVGAFAVNSSAWSFNTHKMVQLTGAVVTSTTTSVTSTSIGTALGTINTGEYIIQFATGANQGLARMITSGSTNTVGWVTALPFTPGTGDQFKIYKSDVQIVQDILGSSDNFFGIAGGTSDTITVTTNPSAGFNLIDGKQIKVRITAVNTTTSPTININSTGAKTITCSGGSSLPVGVFNINQEVILRYNISSNTYEAIGLGGGVSPSQFNNSNLFATTAYVNSHGIQASVVSLLSTNTALTAAHVGGTVQVSGSSGAVALTLPLSTTVRVGASIEIVNSSSYNVSVSKTSTDTLYSINAGAGTITLLPGDNLVVQCSVSSSAGKWITVDGTCQLPLSGTMTGAYWTTQAPGTNNTSLATTAFVYAGLALKANLASPTFTGTVTAPTFSGALSGNATTATNATNATNAGTATNAINVLGIGQSWGNWSGSRAINTWYQNTTSKPIMVNIGITPSGDQQGAQLLCGVSTGSFTTVSSVVIKGANTGTLSCVVPPSWYYYVQTVSGSYSVPYWAELR